MKKVFTLLLLIWATHLHSQVIFSDAFNYSNGNLAGNNSGTGWSGSWTGGNNAVTNSLPNTSGKSVKIVPDGSITSRTFFPPITSGGGTTYYLSFVFNANPYSNLLGNYAGISLTTLAGGNGSLFMGMPGSSGGLGFDWNSQGDYSGAALNNVNYLVLYKIEKAPDNLNTRVSMFATQDLSLTGSTLEGSTALSIIDGIDGNFTYNKIEIHGNYSTGTINIAGLAMATSANAAVSSTQTALPVSWLSFTGRPVHGAVELNWSTASEQNNSHFEVERSADALQFSKIGRVNASTNPIVRNDYQYLDQSPLLDRSFYRLKQVDLDGKFSYSSVIQINGLQATGIKIWSIPRSNKVSILIPQSLEGTAEVMIYDAMGRTVHSKKLLPGRTDINLNEVTSGGVYSIKIAKGGVVLYSTQFIN